MYRKDPVDEEMEKVQEVEQGKGGQNYRRSYWDTIRLTEVKL